MSEPGIEATQSTGRFRFTEQEKEVILSQVSETQSLIQGATPENHDVAAKLENLKRKETTLCLHLSTLVDYIKVNRVPRGLRSNLVPNLLVDDHEFVQKWYGISNQYSQDLMYLMVQHLQIKVQQLKLDISECEEELRNTNSAERYSEVTKNIDITIQRLKDNIIKLKSRKFIRDARDYELNEVYTWNKKKAGKKSQQKKQSSPTSRNPSAEYLSTDSDESVSSGSRRNKRSFLGRQNQREENSAGTSQSQSQPAQNPRPQTRSRTRQDRGRGRGTSRR